MSGILIAKLQFLDLNSWNWVREGGRVVCAQLSRGMSEMESWCLRSQETKKWKLSSGENGSSQ